MIQGTVIASWEAQVPPVEEPANARATHCSLDPSRSESRSMDRKGAVDAFIANAIATVERIMAKIDRH